MIQPKESNSKSHFYISLIKSGLRFVACYALFFEHFVGSAILFALAEVWGIAEEIF